MKKFLTLDFIPLSPSFGLLVLRVWLGLTMLLVHGMMKVQNFDSLSGKFLSLFGIGSKTSLILAISAEVVGAALLVIGLFTRWAALGLAVTMAVAFFMAHKGMVTGDKPGELAFIYLAGFVTLFFTGAGAISADAKLGGGRSSRR